MLAKSSVKTILFLGCSTKAGYFVAKRFSKEGFLVEVLNWIDLPNKYSKFVSKYTVTISPEKDLVSFKQTLMAVLATNKYEAILPVHDAALEIVRAYASEISAYCKVLGLNDDKGYAFAHNKNTLLLVADSLGLKVPSTILVKTNDELVAAAEKVHFPCIVKPVSSAVISKQRLYTFNVKKVDTKEELIDIGRENILNIALMLQEVIEGFGIGYNFFAENGEVKTAYIHKRINEYAGISSYRESLEPNHFGNEAKIKALISKSNWTGVGMIEFKVWNEVPYLMEFNGRFFGSVELSRKNGVDLPKLFHQYYFSKLPETFATAKTGVKARNLHDETLLYLAALAKGKLVSYLMWQLSVLKTLILPNEIIEDSFISDPKFVIAQYRYDLRRILQKRRKKKQLSLEIANREVLTATEFSSRDLIFVCKGNICRSPFAAAYAKLKGKKNNTTSVGTFTTENRLSPLLACKTALEFGCDISLHQSRFIGSVTKSNNDLYIVMDKLNYLELHEIGINAAQIRFLSKQDIADPYKKSSIEFTSAYKLISEAINKLTE